MGGTSVGWRAATARPGKLPQPETYMPIRENGAPQTDSYNLREQRPDSDPDHGSEKVAERLREARKRRFRTSLEASQNLGIKNSTYAAHENGNRQLRPDIAEFYARE